MLVSPIIVVGLPRSGTSFVSKCLSEHFGVRMCYRKYVNDICYEDADIVDLNRRLAFEGISKQQWKKKARKIFTAQKQKGGLWGWKDPRLITMLPWVISHFRNNVTIIRTHRDKELVVKSMVEKLGFAKDLAEFTFDGQNKLLDNALKDKHVIEINYGRNILREEVLVSIIKRQQTLGIEGAITDVMRMVAEGGY